MIYELRASNAHRWMVCAGQPAATQDLPDESNEYADRGTVAHALLELAIRLDLTEDQLYEYEGETLKGVPQYPVDDKMIRGVGHVRDYVASYVALHPGTKVHAETLLEWKHDDQPLGGTADVILDNLPAELVIVDYKNGVKSVSEEDNPQLLSYVIAYLKSTKRKADSKTRFTCVIVQPNARDKRGPVREVTYTMSEVRAFYDRLLLAIAPTRKANAPRVAGDHCTFCAAAGTCRAYGELSLTNAKLDFQQITKEDFVAEPQNYKPKEVAQILGAIASLRHWINAVEGRAIASLINGEKIPGYKLVGSDTRQKWADEVKIIELIPEQALPILAPRKPITPLQMEKRLRKHPKLFNKMVPQITRNTPEPRVVPIDDSRPPYKPGSEFKK